MIVDMPRGAKVGGGVWHEYILLLKKKKKIQCQWNTRRRPRRLAGPGTVGVRWVW